MQIANNELNFFPMTSQEVPDEGPKAIPLRLDFSGTTTEYDLDLTNQQQQGYISMIQTLYIDLSATGAADLVVTMNGSNQVIQAKAGTQGYYSVMCPNPPKLKFTSTADSAVVPVFLINVPIAGVTWSV
jgi:hypothetical protein